MLLIGAGVALVWRQADNSRRAQWLELGRRKGLLPVLRGAAGVVLVGVGVTGIVVLQGSVRHLGSVLQAALAVVVGIALLAGPYLVRITQDLSEERLMRIRAQERAEVAAHVHDSVLHTLTLIQRSADDPREVARLARAQERELRAWLYKPEGRGKEEDEEPTTLAEAVRKAAAEVEDHHGVPIEVVVVGDCPLDEALGAQMQAAREAMVNAAKYGGEGGAVQVFAEVEGRSVFVSVRDRGPGFDLDAVPEDRMGVRESIIGRMERNGGTARLRSAPEGGTVVELEMERARMSARHDRDGRGAVRRRHGGRGARDDGGADTEGRADEMSSDGAQHFDAADEKTQQGGARHDGAQPGGAVGGAAGAGAGRPRAGPYGSCWSTTTGCSVRASRPRSARPGAPASRWSARPPTSTRRSRSSPPPAPRSSCWTSISPAAAVSRCCAAAPR